jgi:PAS domain S-box-containing protein
MKKETKILFIDGEQRYRNKAKMAFVKSKYRCLLGRNGTEGLRKLKKDQPRVVVVDYFLSDMTGEDLYTRYLSETGFSTYEDIPFIALTTNGKVDKSKLYSLGFSACLSKPFRSKELFEFVEDVLMSHHQKMEEAQFWNTIREAKDFLERVVESSVDAIITTDYKGNITYCNRACEELFGYHFEELVGRRVSHFLQGRSSELLKISSILRKRNRLQNYKTKVICKDKQEMVINLSISTMRNDRGRAMGALVITKEAGTNKSSEYDSHVSDRIAAVVETAVAVNHAINNPLVPILGNAQFLLQSEQIADEEVRKRLRSIVHNALRIRDVTQKLANIRNPVTKEYLRGTRMLDIEAST